MFSEQKCNKNPSLHGSVGVPYVRMLKLNLARVSKAKKSQIKITIAKI
jgi:hypothetical protein